MTKNCLVIGDLNIDLVFSRSNKEPRLGGEILFKDYVLTIGGSGGIFASILSKLGGVNTFIISKIGNDKFGNFLIEELKKFNVNTDLIVLEKNGKTGITVSLSFKKDKYQFSSLDIFNNLKIKELKVIEIENLNHVHFASYYVMKSLKDYYIEIITSIKNKYNDVTFSLDTNDDPESLWGNEIYKIFPYIDILFLNLKEARNITRKNNYKDIIEELNKHIKTVVIKLGAEGFVSKSIEGFYSAKAIDNISVDSTGAGDNFDAGFIYSYLKKLSIEKCLNIANLCGSKSVEYIGGIGKDKKYSFIKTEIKKVL